MWWWRMRCTPSPSRVESDPDLNASVGSQRREREGEEKGRCRSRPLIGQREVKKKKKNQESFSRSLSLNGRRFIYRRARPPERKRKIHVSDLFREQIGGRVARTRSLNHFHPSCCTKFLIFDFLPLKRCFLCQYILQFPFCLSDSLEMTEEREKKMRASPLVDSHLNS